MITALPQSKWTRRTADHLLLRAGFGGTADEREALYQLGLNQGIEQAVDSLVEATETWQDHPFPAWSIETDPNGDLGPSSGEKRYDMVQWYVSMLIEGQPLAGKILKFLVDHFPVSHEASRGEAENMNTLRFFDLLRKHAAGDTDQSGTYGFFNTLLNHVSWSESMIWTLDMHRSRANSINENFGRELLELFTLGVDGGYGEDDVGAAAEAFTGRNTYRHQSPLPDAYQLSLEALAPAGSPPGSSYQNESHQDLLPKIFLGQSRTPSGSRITTGNDILEVIFNDLACSRHLCWKLWRYFASPNPDSNILDALAESFRDTHAYQIRPLLREIFLSEAFYDEAVIGHQIKDAADSMISLYRSLGIELTPPRMTYVILNQLNYNPLYPPNIAGWAEPEADGNQWMASGSLLFRINLPSVWIQRNEAALNDWRARQLFRETPPIDLDRIAPPELRGVDNFPMLLARLTDRFMPVSSLRKAQGRLLFDRYKKAAQRLDEEEALKELLLLLMTLPEFQMQ